MDLQQISKDVWYNTYKWEIDNNIEDTFKRVAKDLSSIEVNKNFYQKKFFNLLNSRKFVPGGRIISNAGTGLKSTSLINCHVGGMEGKNQDSIEGIFNEVKDAAKILASEGGYGFCLNPLRPNGAYISGIGVDTPGAVEFLNVWNTMSDVITKGSNKKSKKGKNKIRKGAMMCTLSVWHPDIETFITAKRESGRLNKFNLSVLISDVFMDAVFNNKPWVLEFPDTTFKKYDDEWDGNLELWKSKKYPTIEYKRFENANELWDIIMKSTYDFAEPGIVFVDKVNNLNNLKYCEYVTATNPCGEVPLPIGGSCVLSSINLTQYLNLEKNDIKWEELKKDIPYMVRMLDNVNDITNFPLDIQKEQALQKRRIGIGLMGYGSSLILLKKAYGSKEALELTEKLMSFITNQIYQASSIIACEKGEFPLYDKNKYLKSNFIRQALTQETISLIKKHGIRNSHLLSIAPNGNTSILSNCVSGGLEPVFSLFYTRVIICSVTPEGLKLPTNIKWKEKECNNQGNWKWENKGTDNILTIKFKDKKYRLDSNRGLTYEEEVKDYSVLVRHELKELSKSNTIDYIKTTMNLKVEDHVNTMKIFAKYIDSAISKTVNIPKDYTYENFKNVYIDAFKANVIKGITTYREGTRDAVLEVNNITNQDYGEDRPDHIKRINAPKRPHSLPCDIHIITVQKQKYLVLVGNLNGTLYEVFVDSLTEDSLDKMKQYKNGEIHKNGKGKYNFVVDKEIIIKDIASQFSHVYGTLSRMLSMSLRHGTPLQFIVDQFNKSKEFLGFEKSVARVLKKYIKDGEKVLTSDVCSQCKGELIYQSGCVQCKDCGFSLCS